MCLNSEGPENYTLCVVNLYIFICNILVKYTKTEAHKHDIPREVNPVP